MDYLSGDLLIEGQNYTVIDKRRFLAYAMMLNLDKAKCFDFAYGMSYGEEGKHRVNRSGGTLHRTKGQIFINTFQGKMGEYAIYRYLLSKNIQLPEPDCRKFDLGRWDSFDLICQDKHISIKTTKSFGNLLLLETKDWNDNGEYIPNINEGDCRYDYTLLVRFSPDGEGIMKENGLLDQKDEEVPSNIKEILIEKVRNVEWKFDFPGFIYYSEMVRMIRERRIIPKRAKLNGKVPMDAENYYFQTGNMHNISEMYMNPSEEDDGRENVRLKRTCPKCGGTLVLRKGFSRFWGRSNYVSKNCRYTEKIE